jgi:hypothetical protein
VEWVDQAAVQEAVLVAAQEAAVVLVEAAEAVKPLRGG